MESAANPPMEEPIVFLVPDIHDLQTGGNVFNRRMVAELRPETPVRVKPCVPDARSGAALDGADARLFVVDSLLARQPEALRTLRGRAPATPMILLAHYLHCIDPHASNTEVIAEERAALDIVDGAVTTSRYVRRALSEEGLSPRRVQVVRPGLDERYRGPRAVHLRQGPSWMLTVANLLPEKRLRRFVDVLCPLQDLSWRWVLVGEASLDPGYADGVFRRLRAAGLTDRVTWTGPIAPETLRTWYDRADLFVLPSRFETCSLSAREAMARGLPVVGHRVGGMPENVGDDATAGALVPPNDVRALRAALRSLLADPGARGQRGYSAWRQSQTFPTWSEAATQFRDALMELHARANGTL